jgi:hypothetical protein
VNLACRLILLKLRVLTSEVVKRFAQDVIGPKVREMDENEMMDPFIIRGLFEQGVRYSTFLRRTQLTFTVAHEHRDKRCAWRRRVLVYLSNNCDRGTRQSRPVGICFVRRTQYTRKHGYP